MEKFGVQVDKAKVILCFRNGDKHHAGERMTVSSKKYKTYDQVRFESMSLSLHPYHPLHSIAFFD